MHVFEQLSGGSRVLHGQWWSEELAAIEHMFAKWSVTSVLVPKYA